MFLWRLLNLPITSVYKQVLFIRYHEIIITAVYSNVSPVAQIIQCCIKYNLVNCVAEMIVTGKIITKCDWKKW